MKVLDFLHGSFIHPRRILVLSGILAKLIPSSASVIDIGCGDGLLVRAILERRPDLCIQGVDVLARASAAIPVKKFDGLHLPCANNSIDVAMFIDVLHHCDDPTNLLRDAKRVTRKAILIKDHFSKGFFDDLRLSIMDKIGNARHGVSLQCVYFNKLAWLNIFDRIGFNITYLGTDFQLYLPPLEWIFGGKLHFSAMLQSGER